MVPLKRECSIIVQYVERVGRFDCVLRVCVYTPRCHDGFRKRHIHRPQRDVQQVYAPVRQQSAAVVPEMSPATMEAVAIERVFRRGTEPCIIVNTVGNRRVWYPGASFSVIEVAPCFYFSDRPQFARLHKGHDILPVLTAALLLAYLYNPVVAPGGF